MSKKRQTKEQKIIEVYFLLSISLVGFVLFFTLNVLSGCLTLVILWFIPIIYFIVKWYITHYGIFVNIDRIRWNLADASPKEFEELIADMFRRLGYHSVKTTGHIDIGIDILMKQKRMKYVVQVKKYSEENKVGRPTLQQLQGAAQEYHTTGMKFVTYGYYTNDAKDYAKKHGIELIDHNELIKLMCRSYRKMKVLNKG